MSRFFFSSSKTVSPSYSIPASPSPSSTPIHRKFSLSMMEETIENSESIITKWDLKSSSYTKLTSLFQHDRKEAKEFIKSVKDLRRAMHFLVGQYSNSSKLVLAQELMQTAMKRLEKEFHQILSANRDKLDPESVSSQSSGGSTSFNDEDELGFKDELEFAGESITEMERASAFAMTDLKSIADCMISSGYGRECVKIYITIRKSIIDEGLYRLGVERLRPSQIQKMSWEALVGKIRNWLDAIKIAVESLFNGERILCDHVFSASDTIRESCFYEITKEGAMNLFRFPELIVKGKKTSERIFQLMELCEAISDHLPEIDLVFSSEATSAIRLQAFSSFLKLKDSIHSTLSEFETTIQKDSSKTLVFGGGIHPMTRSAMNYISSLADYSSTLSIILPDYPPPQNSPLQESYFEIPASDDGIQAVSTHLSWLILVLLCKLDIKAELYKDVSLSYLFLANNLQHVVEKVRTTNLKFLLGDDWISKHTKKIQQYASNFESMAWNKVFLSLPEKTSTTLSTDVAKECFRLFNAAFEEAYRKQTSWVVLDGKLRDDLKVSIAKKLVPKYQEFYETNIAMLSGEKNLELLVRFSPDDLGNYLSDLFHGASVSGSSTSSVSQLSARGCLPR
ncbi:hypothetical protein FEM48_Zijuj03G0078500 [Ziziphus jujuba var. spinosa]|uniref:Exocyst subunit Exo70 family protein n=1 Tax=Ziziphus jujuba var. spinosa TaxID=714518 RepID=A0A978VP29_ZIZJJ|nr:hypothetical protein FEM48_Zijuj03G0078500 [Ziziphus jujuba var. spinosa]